MDFNLTGVWGMLKTPSVGFILFILILIVMFKVKDIYNFFLAIKMGEFNKLKFLKKELIELKGDGFSERKLIDKMIEDEVLNLSLGVSNKKIIPVFSYLLTTMNLKSLFYFRKCVNFIDADTISLNEKVITKRRREGACVFFSYF
ncbi:TPA: hypothetical protein ACS772_000285 [Providencia alcalifaciens]